MWSFMVYFMLSDELLFFFLKDVFWTELPTDPGPDFSEPVDMLVPRKSSEQVVELSWTADFVNQDALEGLERHVIQQMAERHNYAPFCSIVQSSGMGKSRLVDEFSKVHFLIPIILRKKGSNGFPPPDDIVRDFLTQFDSYDQKMQEKSYTRACHFLFSLFVCTKDMITTLGADNKKDRIVKFREFMSEEQRFGREGENRRNFYAGVVSQAKKAIDDRLETPSEKKLLGAFETLRGCVCDGCPPKGKPPLADVFIAFDEAHQLTEPWDNGSTLFESNYTELQQVLRIFSTASLFTFFVSTNPEISQFAMPRTIDPFDRILQGRFHTPRPFIELGFDQLMWNRKILDEYKTLEEVASSECIVHMGRPLWGTMYDYGDDKVRQHLIFFAIQKLLGSPIVSADTTHQRYAVLSHRLALDINTTAYISPSPSDAGETLEQMRNHMRVCVDIGEGNETIRGIASSEPILSEAASYVTRRQFDLANALSDVLHEFSIQGDRGELLVAAFFTWARDTVMLERPLPPLEFCRDFSVEELFSCLFSEEIVESIFNHTPSIGPLKAKQRTFGEVASSANMHFSHFIRPQEQEVILRQYLLAFIARGAAVFSADCQADFNAIFPYLYGSTDLDDKHVGFIIVQVKNDSEFSQPNAELFRNIDPFECGLLDESDLDKSSRRFPILIIRIVFALRGKQSTVTPMSYSSPSEGAFSSRFDERGEPRFTSYDYFCSGIGPDLLQPVGEAAWKWEALLDVPDQWSSFYGHSVAPDVLRSQFPASSHDIAHLKRWLSVN
ncbi:hypothetical protein BJV78DRAFT_133573 [Lactifluus subvellereus]|nr:hypothetical protein BJV78DRAFT_133573 [Lactifluus subvellereus]